LLENDVFSLSLSAKYKTELESFHTIDEAFIVLAPYKQSVLTALYSRRKTTSPSNSTKKEELLSRKHLQKNASDVIIEMKEKGLK
jgi:hypothetical protein